MSTRDYEKVLPSGRILVKRSYAYYLYDSTYHVQQDDNHARPFNRAEEGCWRARSRKMSEIMQVDNYLAEMFNGR